MDCAVMWLDSRPSFDGRQIDMRRFFWLSYLAAWLLAAVWIGFWVAGCSVTEDEVTQHVEFGLAVCDTDWDCELYDRCEAGDTNACEVRL